MKSRDITEVALMTALIIALAFIPAIPIGIIPVPIVLQNFGIMLAGLLLGAKKGTLSVLLLLILVAVGLPVLTGFRGGIVIFVGPTGGYLLSWLLMPSLMTLFSQFLSHFINRRIFMNLFMTTLIVSVVISYAIAIVFIAVQSHISLWQSLIANCLFIPGDVLKSLVAAWVASRLLPVLARK